MKWRRLKRFRDHFTFLGGLLRKGWKKDFIPITLGFLYLYIMIWLNIAKWLDQTESNRWHTVMISPVFLFCAAGITLFTLMCKGGEPFKHKFGEIGIWLGIGLGLAFFIPYDYKSSGSKRQTIIMNSAVRPASWYMNSQDVGSECLMPPNLEIKQALQAILDKAFASSDPKVLHDKKKMMWIAWHETRYNQFGNDGLPYHRCPTKENPDISPVGLYQIKETLHRKSCADKGQDIDTFLGNVGCAMILYETRKANGETGFEDWAPVPDDEATLAEMDSPAEIAALTRPVVPAKKKASTSNDTFTIIAVAPGPKKDNWSDWVPINGRQHVCAPPKFTFIQMNGDEETTYKDGPNMIVALGYAKDIQKIRYQGEKEEVTVPCRFITK